MKKRYDYSYLGIACVIVNVIFLIGMYLLYSPIGKISNVLNSGDIWSSYSYLYGFNFNSILTGAKIFAFGYIATIVMAVFLIIYYIYEERKLAIVVSCIVDVIEVFLLFTTVGSLFNLLLNFSFSELSSVTSMIGNLRLLLFVILLGLVIHVIIILQLFNVVHLTFLMPYMPERFQMISTHHQTTTTSQQAQDFNDHQNQEGGDQ